MVARDQTLRNGNLAVAHPAAADGAPPGLAWNPAAEQFDGAWLLFLPAYWQALAETGELPHLKQIDPIALRPALGYVMLLDPVKGGGDFRYRLYGSQIASVSGF